MTSTEQLQQLQDENAMLRRELAERQRAVATRDFVLKNAGAITTFDSVRTIEGRTKTFVNWPHARYIQLRPEDLAAAGFFFTPSTAYPDRVTCAYCSLELGGWEDNNSAVQAHRVGAPACPFVTGVAKDTGPAAQMPKVSSVTVPAKTELNSNGWTVQGHVDNGAVEVRCESNAQEVRISQCEGLHLETKIAVFGTCRKLSVADCKNVRVHVDAVLLSIEIVRCEKLSLVIGDEAPNMVIRNTVGCEITMCPDTMDGDIEAHSSAGIMVTAIPVRCLPRPFRPQHLLAATEAAKVVIPDRMVTALRDGAVVTECRAEG